jgi:hypothetical protein
MNDFYISLLTMKISIAFGTALEPKPEPYPDTAIAVLPTGRYFGRKTLKWAPTILSGWKICSRIFFADLSLNGRKVAELL